MQVNCIERSINSSSSRAVANCIGQASGALTLSAEKGGKTVFSETARDQVVDKGHLNTFATTSRVLTGSERRSGQYTAQQVTEELVTKLVNGQVTALTKAL
jgi:hypothetical protein